MNSGLFQFLVTILCRTAEFFFNTDELIVLGHAVGTAHRTGLDLAGIGSYGDVGNRSVLGLT